MYVHHAFNADRLLHRNKLHTFQRRKHRCLQGIDAHGSAAARPARTATQRARFPGVRSGALFWARGALQPLQAAVLECGTVRGTNGTDSYQCPARSAVAPPRAACGVSPHVLQRHFAASVLRGRFMIRCDTSHAADRVDGGAGQEPVQLACFGSTEGVAAHVLR